MKRAIYLLGVLIIFGAIYSCNKEDDAPAVKEEKVINSMSDLKVSETFNYKMQKKIHVNVQLPKALNYQKKYAVTLYDKKNKQEIIKGASDANGIFKMDFVAPSLLDTIILKTAAGNYMCKVENSFVNFDFNDLYSNDSNVTSQTKNPALVYSFKKEKYRDINLLSNGDFSTNDFSSGNETDAKNNLGKWYVGNINDFSHYNGNSVRYYHNGYTVSAELYQAFSVTAGQDLSLSIDIKAVGFNTSSYLRVAFYDNSGNSVGYQQVMIYPTVSWASYSMAVTVPNNAVTAVFYPIIGRTFPGAEVYIDNAWVSVLNQVDSDNDGVPDVDDAFPNDDTRCFITMNPGVGEGTYVFEDLWPYTGDYDFNDLVINYRYDYVMNCCGELVEMDCHFKIKAVGGSFKNGFGISLNRYANTVSSVSGTINTESYISYNADGTEANQSKTVIIVFDNVFDVITHPGGMGINTTKGNTYVDPVEIDVEIEMNSPMDITGFEINPFLIVNKDRGKEIHLVGMLPTDLVNTNLFGTGQDDSNSGIYYKSKDNLPWALDIPFDFDYDIEKADITQTYLKFSEWVESNGTQYQDWYLDKPGYRNTSNIY